LQARAQSGEVAVRVLEARQERAVACVDDSRLRSAEVERSPIATDLHDAVASDSHGFGGGLPRLRGGVDLRVVNDDGRRFGRWARLTRHERRREDGEDESSHC